MNISYQVTVHYALGVCFKGSMQCEIYIGPSDLTFSTKSHQLNKLECLSNKGKIAGSIPVEGEALSKN